jgi:hypothetical protein
LLATTSGEEVTGSGCGIYFEHRLNCSATVSLARSERGWFKLRVAITSIASRLNKNGEKAMPEPQQIKRIDIGELTENVTIAVQRALEAQKAGSQGLFRNPRIIVGFIIEPQVGIGGVGRE